MTTAPAFRRTSPWLALIALEIGAIAVFWAFDAIPFMDLPGHAGVFAVQARYKDSGFLQQYFTYAPHLGPYSVFRGLGGWLTQWFGPLAAVRTMATLPLLLLPAVMLYSHWRLHGRRHPFAGFFALAISFGTMTMMGFAAFLIAVPIGLLAIVEWQALLCRVDAKRPTLANEIFVSALLVVLYLTHGFAFIIVCVAAGMMLLANGSYVARLKRLRIFVPALLMAGYSEWTVLVTAAPWSGPAAPPSLRFQPLFDKLSLLVTPTLATRFGIDIAVGLGLWAVAVASVVRALRRRDQNHRDGNKSAPPLAVAAIGLFVVFLALPHAIGWFGFVDGRILPIVLLLAIAANPPPSDGKGWAALATGVAAAVIVAQMLIASIIFQGEARGFGEVTAAIPAEARLLYLPIEPDSRVFVAHPFVHYDKLILANRPILPSDLWAQQGTALYPTADNPIRRLPAQHQASDLKQIAWPSYRLNDWDFVLIRTASDAAAWPVPETLVLERHSGGWWLYRTARGS